MLFPNAMSINTREELEEERRLFYVAVTRARKYLYLTYANARYRFGNLVQNEPSRFLDEMPEQYIDKSYAGGGLRNQGFGNNMGSAFERMQRGFGYNDNAYDDVKEAEKKYGAPPKQSTANGQRSTVSGQRSASYTVPPRNKSTEHTPSADFKPSDTGNLQVGQRVEHQKFGFGEVIKMEGAAHNPVATVLFELNGEKKIMLNYAKLMIVE